ncbi:hypothetical protein [Streptomyces sp. NPDC088725]|uniref:hypothetical protein n=1 Tax=Streptomyces sp. NPDC088725 TaxID=3365873 RepID=UPI00381C41E1
MRPIAIDGSRELIDGGLHREAVFWIVAAFARCHTVLAADAPDAHRAWEPEFLAAVADLGILSAGDIPGAPKGSPRICPGFGGPRR